MTDYKAPVDDTRFVLKHLADLDGLAAIPGFEDATSELADSVLEEAGRMAAEVFAPINHSGDQQGVRLEDGSVATADGFAAAYRQFIEAGWLGLAQDPEYGGQGLPFALHMAISEFWNAANLSLALCPMLSVSAVEALIVHGTPELKQRYLPGLVSGKWTGTMNLTEPQAGSDLAAVATRAVPSGDHFLLKGQKIYISWGDHDMADNILHLVLARLPDAPTGVGGISLFLVPKYRVNDDGSLGDRNSVAPVSVEHKLGIHASPTCVIAFGDDSDGSGALGYLVGEPNRGLACMFTMMNHARLEVGLEGVGISDRAYQAAVRYARERKQGRAPGVPGQATIIHHADVRRMLLQMRALTEAGRALALVAGATHDRAHAHPDAAVRNAAEARLGVLTPVVKGWCTEIAQEVTSLAIQVHGGMGYIEETGVAQYYRDARIIPIYEGTNGIQAGDLVGRKLLRDNGEAMQALIAEMRDSAAALAASIDHGLDAIGGKLAAAIDALDAAQKHLLESGKERPSATDAGAFNFLMLTGTVVGGWLMARSAAAAAAVIGEDPANKGFYATKLATARFYTEHVLARAGGYESATLADPALVTALPEEAF